MDKPKPKCEVKVTFAKDPLVFFYASTDAIEEFKEFGIVTDVIHGIYLLRVDARYDFDEVLAYIQNY